MALTKDEIDELIEDNILTGGRRTFAVGTREVLFEMNTALFANTLTLTDYIANPLIRVYEIGNTCVQNGKIYIAIAQTSGPFDIYDWEEISAGGDSVWGGITGTVTDQTDLINYLNANYQAIGSDAESWLVAGNTLASRGKFGSSSGVFGWQWVIDDTEIGGVSNAGAWYWGTTAAFTDTDFSFQGSTADSDYNTQWKNLDNTVLGNLKNNGNAFFKSAVFGTDSPVAGSLVTFYGETTDDTAYALRIRDAEFTTLALWRNDGVCQVKNFLVNNDIPNGADLTTDFTVIGRASGDLVHFKDGAYDTVYKSTWDGYHGFGITPFASTYMSWKTKSSSNSDYAWIVQNSSSSNLIVLTNKGSFGLNGFSYGGGVLYVESGALKYRGSSGTITTIANA